MSVVHLIVLWLASSCRKYGSRKGSNDRLFEICKESYKVYIMRLAQISRNVYDAYS